MVGGDTSSISTTQMFGYTAQGHTNSCLDPMSLSQDGVRMGYPTSTYDEATDTTTLDFANCNSSLTKMRIRNASNPANVIFEIYCEGAWVAISVFSM